LDIYILFIICELVWCRFLLPIYKILRVDTPTKSLSSPQKITVKYIRYANSDYETYFKFRPTFIGLFC